MGKAVIIVLGIATLSLAAGAPPAPLAARAPDSYRYAKQLVPVVVALSERIAEGSAVERKRPEYVAVSAGADEYVYHLRDKIFIRRIRDRYELPPWRICGDFAVVRVEFMDDSMATVPPIMAWHMIYREEQWQRLVEDEGGRFLRANYTPTELPPYAIRCFDKQDR
jgi:hypothetical protein